ncbi:MAG: hypothetical protein HFI49_01555 [Bacilli bacterium]|nr:hypothetical protein [Bacilli bacterium]
MNKKEAFLKFIRNFSVTPEEYNLAKAYYLEDASEEEVKLYDSFLKILVPALQKAYNKSERHLMALSRKHGMSKEEALALIQNFQNFNSDCFLMGLQKQGVNEKEYLQSLYLACHNCNFYKSKIEDFVNNLGISYKLFLELVKIYLKKYLKFTQKDVLLFFNKLEMAEDFYNFLSSKIGNNFSNVLYYFRNFATAEERAIFRSALDKITSEFYQEDLSLEEIARQIEAKYLIPLVNAKRIVSKYRNERIDNKTNKDLTKYKLACDMFLNDCSYQDISNYLKKENISWEYLRRRYVEIYVRTFILEDMGIDAYNKIISRMQEYITINRNGRRNLREKLKYESFDEELFLEAKKVITTLVYGNKGVPTFLRKLGEATFYRYITLIEMYDEPLYNLYLIRRNRMMPFLEENVIKSILFYINNGILENGVLRKFNILDYFRMVRLPIDTFINVLQDYDDEVKKVIVSFLLQNKDRLYPLTNVITSNVDPDDDIIVKKYMILNDLPMFDLVYMLVLEEYHTGVLIFEENSRK